MKVCKLYQLGRVDGNKFSQEHKSLIRDRIVVTEKYYEDVNSTWKTMGKLLEEDKKATEEYYTRSEKYNELREQHPKKEAKELNVMVEKELKKPKAEPKKTESKTTNKKA